MIDAAFKVLQASARIRPRHRDAQHTREGDYSTAKPPDFHPRCCGVLCDVVNGNGSWRKQNYAVASVVQKAHTWNCASMKLSVPVPVAPKVLCQYNWSPVSRQETVDASDHRGKGLVWAWSVFLHDGAFTAFRQRAQF